MQTPRHHPTPALDRILERAEDIWGDDDAGPPRALIDAARRELATLRAQSGTDNEPSRSGEG